MSYLKAVDHDSVCRVELSGNNAMKWSVARQPAGLLVNSEHNLLVVSYGEYVAVIHDSWRSATEHSTAG